MRAPAKAEPNYPRNLKTRFKRFRPGLKANRNAQRSNYCSITFCWKAFLARGNWFWRRFASNLGFRSRKPGRFTIMRWFRFARFFTSITRPSIRPRKCCGCYRSTVLPELYSVVGEKCFARPMDIFAGVTVTFPSKSVLEKIRKSRQFLNRLDDEKQTFSPSSLSANAEHQLLSGVLEGYHSETPLYTLERT